MSVQHNFQAFLVFYRVQVSWAVAVVTCGAWHACHTGLCQAISVYYISVMLMFLMTKGDCSDRMSWVAVLFNSLEWKGCSFLHLVFSNADRWTSLAKTRNIHSKSWGITLIRPLSYSAGVNVSYRLHSMNFIALQGELRVLSSRGAPWRNTSWISAPRLHSMTSPQLFLYGLNALERFAKRWPNL